MARISPGAVLGPPGIWAGIPPEVGLGFPESGQGSPPGSVPGSPGLRAAVAPGAGLGSAQELGWDPLGSGLGSAQELV